MKQCPDPNCILYTRLEELPDAYVKCPGCGGRLVSVTSGSQMLDSSRLNPPLPPQQAAQSDPYGALDPDDPYAPPPQYQVADPNDPDDPYAPMQAYQATGAYGSNRPKVYTSQPSGRPDSQPFPTTSSFSPSQWTRASKIAFGVGSVLLLVACGLLGWIFTNRFFPQSHVIASPQATQTAFAALRPPVNTPITGQPTVQAGVFNPTISVPTQQAQQPTAIVLLPTQVPPTEVVVQALPTWTPLPIAQPPTANSQPQPVGVAPTAPPAQQQPSAGVIEAHMAAGLDNGQPRGVVGSYSPTDPFSLAVQATFGQGAATSVLTRWYGPDGALIYSMQKNYTLPGVYYVGFTVRKNGPWAPGNYRVDVHTNGSPTPSYSVPFTVAQ